MPDKLSMSLSHHAYLLKRLREEFPEADEETLMDTVEGLSDLDEVIAEIARSRLDDLALTDALRRRRDDMQTRLSRLTDRAEKKKALIADALERSGVKKIMRDDFTLSLRAGTPGLQVSEEEAIPEEYWQAQPPKLDRQAVLAALKRGEAVPGASLSNSSPTISLRTR